MDSELSYSFLDSPLTFEYDTIVVAVRVLLPASLIEPGDVEIVKHLRL